MKGLDKEKAHETKDYMKEIRQRRTTRQRKK
jgi:hypothetical protein